MLSKAPCTSVPEQGKASYYRHEISIPNGYLLYAVEVALQATRGAKDHQSFPGVKPVSYNPDLPGKKFPYDKIVI